MRRHACLVLALACMSCVAAPGIRAVQCAGVALEHIKLADLRFKSGYPSQQTAACLSIGLVDFQRATQAYLWALAAVGFMALYDVHAKTMGVRIDDVLLTRTLQDKAGMLTPSITNLHIFSFRDLAAQGPLVV